MPLVNLGSLIIGGGNQNKLNVKQKVAKKVEPETTSWNIGKENVRLCRGTVGVGAERPEQVCRGEEVSAVSHKLCHHVGPFPMISG